MKVTIDRAGRMVVPKALRDELGLVPGCELEAVVRDGRLEIEPVGVGMCLVERDGVLVAVADRDEMPPLSAGDVRAALEQTRR